MTIPYRTRQTLRRMALVLLAVLLVAVLVWGCWIVWLSRYVIYTQDGAKIDFSLPEQLLSGTLAQPPEPGETIPISYDDAPGAVSTELAQINGYYVDAAALKDIPAVHAQIQALPAGTAVMVDVKNIYGSFYYSSGVSTARSSSVDIQAMDGLIEALNKSNMYTIARLPALRDYQYGLNHVPDGLPTAGGYLWLDSDGCYWLNPASSGTLSYLIQIVNELKSLGFDEVVFYDFYFPDTTGIVYKNDKAEALATAAKTLVSSCATDSFGVSFVGKPDFALPEGRSRLYIENAEPINVAGIAQQTGLADPEIRLVFLTTLHDTRFDKYSVLRPLSAAH